MSQRGIVCVISKPSPNTSQTSYEAEVREAHKGRRIFFDIEGVTVLSHEHYQSKDERACMDLYEVDSIAPLLEEQTELAQGGQGPLLTENYFYRQISAHGATASHSSEEAADLVMVSFEPPMTELDNMNRWYEEEHVPMLAKVPGWLSTLRGSKIRSSGAADPSLPKYAAFHRYTANNGCNTSQQWKDATSTSWAHRVKDAIDREGSRKRSQWTFVNTH